jgi:murein DD-endopeptidase MepM/ murein hydrolase activator NlpD
MKTMDRRSKLAALFLVALAPLAACTESPRTQLSWDVNDRAAASQPAPPRQASAKTYSYDGDSKAASAPRPDYTPPARSTRITSQDLAAPTASPARPMESSSRFLWPADGRVISNFGPASDGGRNDGINIAVAAGTPIKAAASGRVTYAGNGLKEYGNLLLIQHSDGFVTAYAHAEKLLVQQGDVVSRGQVIGYAGRTGDVSSPQLHFEIRHGRTPVDPDDYLAQRNS